MTKRQKVWLKISGAFSVIGIVIMSIVAYFVIQTIRETLYQNAFDKGNEFVSLEEDGVINTVQVFHGVKIHTFNESDDVPSTIILELNEEEEAKLKDRKVNPNVEGMQAYSHNVLYKVIKNNKTGKEHFIVSLQTIPPKDNGTEAEYTTFSINENGIVEKSQFTNDTKNKLETQWIRGISDDVHGYYTDLPYQDGATSALLVLALIGVLLITSGFLIGKSIILKQKQTAA